MKRNILLIITSLILVGCHTDVVYTEFHSMPKEGWEMNNVLTYKPEITDTTQSYNLQVVLRHDETYSYQNIWMFVDIEKGEQQLLRDTIECMLANDRGEWIGNGMSVKELPMMYRENYRFTEAGEYTIKVQQGMRDTTLVGVKEVGVKIEMNEGEE